MKSTLLRILPHIVAVVAFVVIANTFFSLINDDYGLNQHDITKVMGMSKELADYRLVNHEEALWSNNMFGGMPGFQTNVIYTSNLLRPIDHILKLGMDPAVGSLFMCMLGFYILMLCMRVNPWLGIVGAISFGLSTINILYIGGGHTSKVNAIGYMAPVLGGLILAYRGKWILGSAVFSLFLGLHLVSNHLQMTYYLVILVGAVALTEFIRLIIQKQAPQALKTSAALLVAGVIGFLPNLGSIYSTYEYSKYTTRGKTEVTITPPGAEDVAQASDGLKDSYILEYNMAAGEPWAMAIPNAKGGSSSTRITDNKEAMQKAPRNLRENLSNFSQYWGEQGSSAGAFYFGAAIMFLFALALIFSKDSLRWPFLVVSLLAIFLCMKDMHALNDFFIHKFPMYNKFRDSKMILVLIQIMAPAFGLLFIDSLLKNPPAISSRKWLIGGAAGLTVFVLLVTAMPTITGPLISSNEVEYLDSSREQYKSDPKTVAVIGELEDAIQDVRKVVFAQDAQRSLLIILVMATMTILVVFGKLKWYLFAAISGVLVTADMWSVSSRYMNENKVRDPQTKELVYEHYAKNVDRIFPYKADKCDEFILSKEKANIAGFDEKVNELESALNQTAPYNGVKSKDVVHMAAEFGALQLNSDYRVLLPNRGVFSESSMAYFHKSIGGYHAAKLKRYQEIIDFYLGAEINSITSSFSSGNLQVVDSTVAQCKVLNMLNTRYVKYSGDAPPLDNSAHALGNAWFVSDLKMVNNGNDEISAIKDIDPAKTAIVRDEFASIVSVPTSVDSAATISLTNYATKKLTYASKNSVAAPVVFSEIYYPDGWVCRIDGNETPAFRADYFLRGVMVPAGEHVIEWSFEPSSFYKSNTINWIASVILILMIVATFGWSLFRFFKSDSSAVV